MRCFARLARRAARRRGWSWSSRRRTCGWRRSTSLARLFPSSGYNTYIHIYIYIHVFIHTHIYIYVYVYYLFIHLFTFIYLCLYIQQRGYFRHQVRPCVCVRVRVYVYVCCLSVCKYYWVAEAQGGERARGGTRPRRRGYFRYQVPYSTRIQRRDTAPPPVSTRTWCPPPVYRCRL